MGFMDSNQVKKMLKRKYFVCILLLLSAMISTNSIQAAGNQARKILDRTASVVGRKGGVQASFTITNMNIGSTSGTIHIKGSKFYATTPQAVVWFNGKTEWSYMRKNNEVYISTPSLSQQISMNPYTFIRLYQKGYNLSVSNSGANYKVRLVAQSKRSPIQELYVYINKKSYIPNFIKMKQGNVWSDITIRNFSAVNQSDNLFIFNSRNCGKAEIIDLR